jgi:two-component system response regulator BaeR
MSRQTILIAEDEPKIAELLAEYLQIQGDFDTHVISRGDEVPRWVQENGPDLVLLDLMMPGLDGLEVCKHIRQSSQVPIIMVTARVEEIDRLLGLELGADDYICKPFSPREVVARVRAVLRRSNAAGQAVLPGLEVDQQRFKASLNGKELTLTPVEFALLHTLSEQPGRIFSRDQLMDNMYSDHRVVNDRAVDTHIKNLRNKLSLQQPGSEFIESIYGLGYRIITARNPA